MRAAQHGQLYCVRELLVAGTEVNQADNAGITAHKLAQQTGNQQIIDLLTN